MVYETHVAFNVLFSMKHILPVMPSKEQCYKTT